MLIYVEVTPEKSSQHHVINWNGRGTRDLPLTTSGSSRLGSLIRCGIQGHRVRSVGCSPSPWGADPGQGLLPQPGAPSCSTTPAAGALRPRSHTAPCATAATIGPGLTAHRDRGPAPGTARGAARSSHFSAIRSRGTAGCCQFSLACWVMPKVGCDHA